MPQLDNLGREYLKISTAKRGMKCICDDGFTCVDKFETVRLDHDLMGQFYFICADGQHYLSGQDDGDGYAIGIYPVKSGETND